MKKVLFAVACLLIITSCTKPTINIQSLIPAPVSVTYESGSFQLTDKTVIYIPEAQSELQPVAEWAAQMWRASTGFELKVLATAEAPSSGV
ncbi:MAG: glycoside hydrolase family 20 zincin-like fold domain-containing protein, partial [Cyclobacteriaceae bacterium]|nr:glycoside hydrolase family 20 zincin-like fold domain-containing protein [Cyclobacteriaceae bacterium]